VTQSHSPQPPWREIYQDGSEQAEQDHFRELADRIVGVQRESERKSGSPAARRTFHAKIVVGVDNAELAFPADLPAGLSAGDFTPGARLPATVRLSNASGSIRPDSSPDLRGAALWSRGASCGAASAPSDSASAPAPLHLCPRRPVQRMRPTSCRPTSPPGCAPHRSSSACTCRSSSAKS